MITSLCWVPKGVTASLPVAVEPSPDELKAWAEEKGLDMPPTSLLQNDDDAAELGEDHSESIVPDAHGDDSNVASEDSGDESVDDDEDQREAMAEFEKVFSMSDYDAEGGGVFDVEPVEFDDKMTRDMIAAAEEDDLYDETIKDSDALLLTAIAEEDMSTLYVRVYEEEHKNMYTHHEILLSAFVLCMEHIALSTDGPGKNLLAIGTFDPKIEVWDLDVGDALEPIVELGTTTPEFDEEMEENLSHLTAAQRKRLRQKKKKKQKKAQFDVGGHKDAVMGLSWNTITTNVLASSSADKTVKIWNLSEQTCLQTYTHHADKVQAVEWNPSESGVLLTGSYDKRVCMFDIRSPEKMAQWNVSSDVECVHWDPHRTDSFFVSCEDGSISYFSVHSPGTPVWTVDAHSKATSSIANSKIPGYFASGSLDKTIKLWRNDPANPSAGPTLLHTAEVASLLGKVFSLQFMPDSPFLLAAGGKQQVHVWHTDEVPPVKETFSSSS